MDLKAKKCKPCEGGTKPMNKKQAAKYLRFVEGWKLGNKLIYTNRKFKDFGKAIAFTNRVASVAEGEGHHPDIYIHDWNQVRLTSTTHAIKGLSINDFILAAKINAIK